MDILYCIHVCSVYYTVLPHAVLFIGLTHKCMFSSLNYNSTTFM